MNTSRIVAALTAVALAASSGLAFAQPDRGHDRGHDQDRGHEPRGHAYGHDRDPREGRDDHAWHRGDRLPTEYRNRQYVVNDWRGHRLSAPPRGYQWVQADGNYVLAAIATGVIASVLLANHLSARRKRARRSSLGLRARCLFRFRRGRSLVAAAARGSQGEFQKRHHRSPPGDRSLDHPDARGARWTSGTSS